MLQVRGKAHRRTKIEILANTRGGKNETEIPQIISQTAQ